MNLGRVIGTVVATRKYEGLEGVKLLLVQPLDHTQKKIGDPIVAADTVRAGTGELIYFVNSREAALALDPWFVPVDASIVGIVDDVDAAGPTRHAEAEREPKGPQNHEAHEGHEAHKERHSHKHGRRKNGARV